MEEEIFTLSSTERKPSSYLKGFAFDGADLICGNDGYERFRAGRRKLINPGGDGAYVVVNKTHTKTIIGTDYTGYYKLYVYQHGDFWALSNSLIELAKIAHKKGLPVTINHAQLASFLIYPRRFGDQLSSLSTSVREIKTLPARVQIEVTESPQGENIEFNQIAEDQIFQEGGPTYEAQLSRFLSVWLGRFVAILNSEINVKMDVTGGLDSRTVLSLLLGAAEIAGRDKLKRILFYSNSMRKADYRVSCQLAENQGFEICHKIYREYHIDDYRVDTEDGYAFWKKMFPGTYMPVIFPTVRRDSTFIWVAGNGGEAHRPDYQFDTLEDLLDNGRQFIKNPDHFDEIRETTLSDMNKLQFGLEANLNPVLGHYRNFRDRFHHGRRAVVCNAVTPLSSALLRFANNVSSPEVFQSGRLLTDIITNCRPELFSIPFDDPRKQHGPTGAMSGDQIGRLLRQVATGGTVYSGTPEPLRPGRFIRRNAIKMLQADFQDSLSGVTHLDIFSSEYIEMAEVFLTDAISQSNFAKSRHGSPAALLTFAADIMKIAGS